LIEETKPQDLYSRIKSAKKIIAPEVFVKKVGVVSLMLMLTSGCVVVGGYSSERGWYLWPGPLLFSW
jgi:hypothetical protein